MKKIIFRTDSSGEIGSGHLMRCLTLASKLAGQGAEICFISRAQEGNFLSALGKYPFLLSTLPTISNGDSPSEEPEGVAHGAWLGVPQAADHRQTKLAAEKIGWESADLLVVDHYGIDERWEASARKWCKKILVIDDLADRSHDCDWLLDQNFFLDLGRRYEGKIPLACEALLGPEFALLREEFSQIRRAAKTKNFSDHPTRILINFGGSDPYGLALRSVRALAAQPGAKFEVVAIAGTATADDGELGNICAAHGWELHGHTQKIHEFMAWADIGLGAGGGSIWERCCMGLPSVVVTFSENQRPIAHDAHQKGLLLWAGHYDNTSDDQIVASLTKLIGSPGLRSDMRNLGMRTVDGLGAARVVERIMS